MSRNFCLLSLSLSLILVFVAIVPAEAVKIILEKEMAFTVEGEPDGFQEFTSRTLEALRFDTIMEYGYYLAGEVAEEDLVAFQRTAASLELIYEIRRDFDIIHINGYMFSSFGEPIDLPASLRIDEYEGDVGMYLVQFKAPTTPEWLRGLHAIGEIIAYFPQNTFLIRASKVDFPILRGVNGDGFYRGVGVAPSAQIIVGKNKAAAADQTSTDKMTHIDFKEMMVAFADQGARFANNSWNLNGNYDGLSQYQYTLFSKMADQMVRDNDGSWGGGGLAEGMTIVFSAGNWSRPNSYPPDADDPHIYVTSPANAKNVITVGATRGWVSSLGVDNFIDCKIEDSDEDYEIRNIAEFSFYEDEDDDENHMDMHSRRGYVDDLGQDGDLPRYKPDLVAMGTHGAGSRTLAKGQDEFHQCFGGTSGAAPAVTGAAVLAETWYWYKLPDSEGQKQKPSPAMIKAMLVAHTDDLEGGEDYDDSLVDYRPSLPQGWGRVNLDGLFQEDIAVEVLDQDIRDYRLYPNGRPDDARRFTGLGQVWSDSFVVDDPTEVVTVVMVYTDRFAWQGADPLTVNDLNLQVIKTGSTPAQTRSYWGNYFDSDGFSKRVFKSTSGGARPDSINTVEMVHLRGNDLAGSGFVIQVRAARVNRKAIPGIDGGEEQPNQDFALYVFNAELEPDQ